MGDLFFVCRGEGVMNINEIFTSIDGEVNKWGQGILTTFIRTQKCNLRCSYCDTPKALDSAIKDQEMSVWKILNKAENIGCKKVTITGGEPLIQEDIFLLIDGLIDLGFHVSIETNGSVCIPRPYLRPQGEEYKRLLNWVVDYKMEYERLMVVNWLALSNSDWIKFVVTKENVDKTFNKIKEMITAGVRARIAVSAVDSKEHKWLAGLLIKEKMWDVNLNVQIHKGLGIR